MEPWQKCLRVGFMPSLPTRGLEALQAALLKDTPKLLQGATTCPPPLQCCQDWPVEAADPIAYALWQGLGLTTVGQVEEAWARACFECDQRLGVVAGCRFAMTWWDDSDYQTARLCLLAEVNIELRRRAEAAA